MQRPSGNVPSGDGEHGEMAPERIEEETGVGGGGEAGRTGVPHCTGSVASG